MNDYKRINWENSPSTATPLTAENLNHMDDGIEAATQGVTALEKDVTSLEQLVASLSVGSGGTGTVPPNVYELLSNKVKTFDKKFSDSEKYPTALAVIKYLTDYYYDYDEIDDMLGKKADELGITVLFDSNFIPIECAILPELGAGFATGNQDVVTVFVPSTVTSITSGAFYGCTNLKDIYIDNVAGAVEISPKTIPDTTEIHYADDFNALSNAFKGLMGVNSKINGKADTEAVNEALNKKADKATTLSGYEITDAYTKTDSKSRFALSVSVLFDENDIPIKTSDLDVLSAGYATSNLNVKTAFVSSKVTRIQSGAFIGCSNLTDMYIDNINKQITIEDEAIPSTATIHYVDDYNMSSQIENALKNISNSLKSVDASNITGKIPVDNLPDEALTKLVTVVDDDTRMKLTSSTVQSGDFVKVVSTGKIYIVKSSGRFGTEDAFEEITGSSPSSSPSSVTWSGITNKPKVKHTLTGDVTGTTAATVGSTVSIATTLKDSGVSAGTYNSVTVNEKGIVIAGTNNKNLSVNIKSGEKDLIPIYDMGASLRYAKCAYQLIGDFVTMTVDIVLNSNPKNGEDGLLFGGLPYPFSPVTSTGSLRGICVSTNNSLVRWRLNNASVNYQGQNLNATCLNITNDSGAWKSGEGIGFTIVYKADRP